MVKVLRCPACGALWRLSTDQKPQLLRCSECGSVFPEGKAEHVEVDEALLDVRLAREHANEAVLQQKSDEADVTMSRLAEELSDFDAGHTTDKPEEKELTPDIRTSPQTKKSSALWGLLLILALLILCATGLLFGHKYVLKSVPQVRSLYENVCTKVPCPGFVWTNSDAFTVTAEIAAPDLTVNDLESEMSSIMPVVLAQIKNHSLHPQYLPILELKLIDAAGETIAQRILEPSEYGFAKESILLPNDSCSARLSILTPLPYQAHEAVVTPVSDLR